MAISPHFFNKRETETPAARQVVPLPQSANMNAAVGATAAQELARANMAANATGTSTANTVDDAGAPPPPPTGGSKLTVGPNIKLKGVEITDCDTLVVEGFVEATMDSRLMEIAEQGAFKGSAEIDIAEIRGQFDGDLTVRQKLVIYATGRVTGKIRYGKLVVEEGGQITGDIQFGTLANARPSSLEKPLLTVAGKGQNQPLAL